MRRPRGSFWAGLFVVLIGIGLLFAQLQPNLVLRLLGGNFSWPWIVIGVGVIFLFLSLLSDGAGLVVPACVIITVGGILLYQVQRQDWESWAFVWALLPASAGLGMIISGFLRRKNRLARTGMWFFFTNLVLFGVFWAIFRRDSIGLLRFWPVLLVGLGLIFIIQAFQPKNRITP
jgi:hypothetical protein